MLSKLKDVKIMLVDDDRIIRDSLSLLFQSEGCHFTALESAEKGIEALKRENYDIIISDYMLPGISGLEFLKHVQESHPDALKVFITASYTSDVFYEALEIGVQDFIQKPYTTSIIEKSFTQLLEKDKGKNPELHINGEKLLRFDEVVMV
jgi:DNA-binding NtrC family response regulator